MGHPVEAFLMKIKETVAALESKGFHAFAKWKYIRLDHILWKFLEQYNHFLK
jgi:hypothetical protein